MSPGSPDQLFEQKLASLYREIDEVICEAERRPQVVAMQDVRVQLLLSYLRAWRQAPERLRAVG